MGVELVTTEGIFALDGGEWQVTNNIWIVGDDREVLVFDAAHDAAPIVEAVNGRRVKAIVLAYTGRVWNRSAAKFQTQTTANTITDAKVIAVHTIWALTSESTEMGVRNRIANGGYSHGRPTSVYTCP